MNNTIKIAMLGDLVGQPGVEEVFLKLNSLRNKEKIDFIIANGENADNGFGITEQIIINLINSGVNVITSGNHIWSNNDAAKLLTTYDILLRPANYPEVEGKGYCIRKVGDINIGVVNLMGRYNMIPIDCPFQTLNKLLRNELKNCEIVVVDFHAEYNPEKITLAMDFDGRVSLVAGTHTHTQTADETILPKGTGYITDIGMCGGLDSIIGMEKNNVLEKIINQSMAPFIPSKENCKMQGIIAGIDKVSFKTVEIKRFSI
ncbi:MAG TPA: TIGR00282 family metallophosphoesterase [Spirochaetota bacterium]|nr:TIGR00282 family metallophosphoesterase [Spirochaetota bacterium]HOL57565.1 TIGR00282 family metallophosphoesterase [Spirochaetota bacterium]HPP05123.1 TIGR00282 family metallophosphoesterase [Spirochaetota bacterium]